MPKILQSDNGLEFKNRKMVALVNRWDGDCTLIYGRPRHPQTQGLVEQANGTVEKMIAAAMEQHKTKEWTKLLPSIQFTLNTSKPSSTRIMPFKAVFNKQPNFGNKKRFIQMDGGKEVELNVDLVATTSRNNEEIEPELHFHDYLEEFLKFPSIGKNFIILLLNGVF